MDTENEVISERSTEAEKEMLSDFFQYYYPDFVLKRGQMLIFEI